MILIVAFAFLWISLSATSDERRVAAYGEEAPAVVMSRSDSLVALESFKGKWTVLSFWSSTDPVSRLAQNRIAAVVRASRLGTSDSIEGRNDAEIEFKTPAGVYSLGNRTPVEVMSVNFDSNESMMAATVRLDNLLESSQGRVTSNDEISRLRQAFAMEQGLRTFLIDPDGKLVMADPDEASLRLLLARS